MRLSSLLFLFVLLAPQIAAAQAQSVAIFSLDADKQDAVLADTLTSVVRNEALQSGRYEAVNKFPIQMEDIALLAGCSAQSPSCLKQVASEVQARVLIYGLLRRPSSDALQIEVNIFDGQTGEMLNRLTRTLPTSDDPVVGFRKEIEEFFEADGKDATETRLTIGSNVIGAQVTVDGEVVGVTPLDRRGLAAGKHVIRVTHPNHQGWETQVNLEAGATQEVWAQLAASETPETVVITQVERPMPEPPRGTNWAAWSVISVGGLGLASALVTGLMMESTEDTVASEESAGVLTERRYEQLYNRGQSLELAHHISLGVGIAAVTVGGAMLIIGAVSDGGATVSVGPSGISTTFVW